MNQENKQPFEQYPELSELILYAATNWKVNYKWSQTLGAINKICAELTELRNASQHSYTKRKWVSEVENLKQAINYDKTGLAKGLSDVYKLAKSYDWIKDGRGPYAFDDERYKGEVLNMINEIQEISLKALRESGVLANNACGGIFEPLTPPTYTQEQMIAFGETVKREAADIATAYTYLYEHECRKDILNINIFKLLKTI